MDYLRMQRLRDYDRDKVDVSSIMCANGWLFDAALIGYLQDRLNTALPCAKYPPLCMLILMETFECSRFILDKKFVLLIAYFNECVIRDWRPMRFLEIFKNYLEIQKVILYIIQMQ